MILAAEIQSENGQNASKLEESFDQSTSSKEFKCYLQFMSESYPEETDGGTTAYQLLHLSINRQVDNMITKNDANLALSTISIESPL
ncbi:hypothetical protein TNCV_806541 [Trichonephila clavipes]|nr:hypothetical protein TNCV_806541 [Trichonephila clavipes]